MNNSRKSAPLLSALLLVMAAPIAAQEAGSAAKTEVPAQVISPEAQAVVDNMTAYLRTLTTFSIEGQITRDEVVAFGYKVQHNERANLTVQLPNKLRAEVSGDLRNRTFVYDGAKLVIYSPDDEVYARTDAPGTVKELLGNVLDTGIDLPMIDVLYQTAQGTLTTDVTGGVLVGDSNIDGSDCDQLAFRQATLDWQLWVEKGAKPMPRKFVITTRYNYGGPQFQAILRWNLKPKTDAATFAFTPPKGVNEIPFRKPAAANASSP